MSIYKYISPTQRNYKNIEERIIYFQDPQNFNDPFDSRIDFETAGTEFEWRVFFQSFGRNSYEINNFIEMIKSENPPDATRLILNGKFNYRERTRVSCFTRINLNILLWGHYANKIHWVLSRF